MGNGETEFPNTVTPKLEATWCWRSVVALGQLLKSWVSTDLHGDPENQQQDDNDHPAFSPTPPGTKVVTEDFY